jgi:hypothetical protein
VVYTQGLIVFVLFILTKAINHDFLQAILDPFSLSTLSMANKNWTVEQNNSLLIPYGGVMFWNKLFWLSISLACLAYGYRKFQLNVITSTKPKRKKVTILQKQVERFDLNLCSITPKFNFRVQVAQLFYYAWFEMKYILKQTLFWAIVICGLVIIVINSINLGTTHHVDSLPTTYLIIEELKEMSIYFFVFVLLIYSGETIWKEKDVNFHLIHDATPVKSAIHLSGKFLGLMIIYFRVISLFSTLYIRSIFLSGAYWK